MSNIKVMVKFYPKNRSSLPSLNYRPHFVVSGDSEYLGVEFIELDVNEYGVFGRALVKPLYDNVGYHKLNKGVHFNIIEGSTLVGEGEVSE